MRDFVSPSPSGVGLGHIVESSGFFRDVIEDVVLYPIGTRFGQGTSWILAFNVALFDSPTFPPPSSSSHLPDSSITSVSLPILDHFINKHRSWLPKLCNFPFQAALELEEKGRVELEGLRLCAEGTGLHIRAYSLTAIRI